MPKKPLTDAQRRLNAARERRRRANLGPPLSVDDATLDAMSTVGPIDQAEIEAYVRDAAGQKGVDLLRAKREDT